MQWSVAVVWLASVAKGSEVCQWLAFQLGVGGEVQGSVPVICLPAGRQV